MIDTTALPFINEEYPFTELFSMLKNDEIFSEKNLVLSCNPEKLKAMRQHADNAISLLLQGLQDLGKLMVGKKENMINVEMDAIGFFISGICNLIEALDVFRLDADDILKEREG